MVKEKILHIITISFVINHFFGNQFNYLKKKSGNEYHLGCSPSDEFFQLSEQLGYKSFPVTVTRSISPLQDLIAIFSIYNYIKKNKIDKVVGHTPKGGMVSMVASFIAGVPERIYFRHGIIYETSTGFKRMVLKFVDKLSGTLATKVVCVSGSVMQISNRDKLNASQKNIILGRGTCNGIDTENKFNPEKHTHDKIVLLRNSLGILDNDFVIGYVGRLVKDKGINELIKAWNILKKKYPNIKLLLVGPIEERDSISEESRIQIENDPNILYTGFVLDSSSYFKLMDVFILPTYREGFPTVSLEASSMDLPVLITRATGCQEAIIEEETGFFIEISPKDIADKIEFYITNPELGKKQGRAGRKFVREHFEQTKIWDQIHTKLKY